MEKITFSIITALTLVSAIAAVSLKKMVHCALCLALAFAGIAAIYLQLGAPFIGWSQVLVYIGAVSVLIVFAILLTRGSESSTKEIFSRSVFSAVLIAVSVFSVLAYAVASSSLTHRLRVQNSEITVRDIGNQLMTKYVLPLEAIGLLLTATAIGAVVIAMKDPAEDFPSKTNPDSSPL